MCYVTSDNQIDHDRSTVSCELHLVGLWGASTVLETDASRKGAKEDK
jgi:hypothetical protein